MPTIAQSGVVEGVLPTNALTATGINITEAANQTLYVFVTLDIATPQDFGAPAFNSVAMTEIDEAVANTGRAAWLGELRNPDAGSAYDITFPGAALNNVAWRIIWIVVNDNDQTTPWDNLVKLENASLTTGAMVGNSAVGDRVLAFISVNNKSTASVAPDGAGNSEILEANTDGALYAAASHTDGSASPVTSSWSWAGGTAVSGFQINLKAAGAGGPPTLMLGRRKQVFVTNEVIQS